MSNIVLAAGLAFLRVRNQLLISLVSFTWSIPYAWWNYHWTIPTPVEYEKFSKPTKRVTQLDRSVASYFKRLDICSVYYPLSGVMLNYSGMQISFRISISRTLSLDHSLFIFMVLWYYTLKHCWQDIYHEIFLFRMVFI